MAYERAQYALSRHEALTAVDTNTGLPLSIFQFSDIIQMQANYTASHLITAIAQNKRCVRFKRNTVWSIAQQRISFVYGHKLNIATPH